MTMMTTKEKFLIVKETLERYVPDYTRNQFHLYADYFEIIALFSNKDGVTKGDLLDRLYGTSDDRDSKDDGELGSLASEVDDNNEIFVNNVLRIIEERVLLFKDDYPFTYIEEHQNLLLKENVNYKQKTYLLMLILSKLNIFDKVRPILTTEFETISFHALKNFLPERAEVREFGKNSNYKGNARTKIKDFITELSYEVDEYNLAAISIHNNQERGLDIAGWIPFEDPCQAKIVILAQCAAGKNWSDKQQDLRRFISYFRRYKLPPILTMFIPYDLINFHSKKYYQSDSINDDYLFFGRKRILQHFEEEDILNCLDSKEVIDLCLEATLDIV